VYQQVAAAASDAYKQAWVSLAASQRTIASEELLPLSQGEGRAKVCLIYQYLFFHTIILVCS
jgi:hypothetical protein